MARVKYNAVMVLLTGKTVRVNKKPLTSPKAYELLRKVKNLRQYKGGRGSVCQNLTFKKGE